MNRYVKIDEQNKVVSVRYGISAVECETESQLGEIGQIKQLDGSFVDDNAIEVQPYSPTNAEIAQMVSDLQADLMIAGVI